jgi:hypothetical protein
VSSYPVAKVERMVAVAVVMMMAAVVMGAVETAAVVVMTPAVHDTRGPQGRGGHEELLHCERAWASP